MSEQTLWERLQEEVEEIARVLMKERPGATMSDVWTDAIALHRVRYIRPVYDERMRKNGWGPYRERR